MSFYSRFRLRTEPVTKADADPYRGLPEEAAVKLEATRRAHRENSSVLSMGGRRMSPREFDDRVEDHAEIVRRERAALAAAEARTRHDPVLTSRPPPPRLRADGAAPPGKAKGAKPKHPDPVIDAPPPAPSLRDDGEAVVKADRPEPTRRKVVTPRSQRIRKRAIDNRDLDLSRPADVAAAVRSAALRNRRKA